VLGLSHAERQIDTHTHTHGENCGCILTTFPCERVKREGLLTRTERSPTLEMRRIALNILNVLNVHTVGKPRSTMVLTSRMRFKTRST
jgi:hypothetical protein